MNNMLAAGDARGGKDLRARLREQGVAYVEFALRYPGRFRLMFRDRLLADDAGLRQNANAAFRVLEDGVRSAFGVASDTPLSGAQWSALLAIWSLVHGYAHLAIAGRFDWLAGAAGREAFVEGTLRPVMDTLIAGILPGRAVPPAPTGSRTRGRKGPPYM